MLAAFDPHYDLPGQKYSLRSLFQHCMTPRGQTFSLKYNSKQNYLPLRAKCGPVDHGTIIYDLHGSLHKQFMVVLDKSRGGLFHA